MNVNLKPVLKTVLKDYARPLGGDHGVAHWASHVPIPITSPVTYELCSLSWVVIEVGGCARQVLIAMRP